MPSVAAPTVQPTANTGGTYTTPSGAKVTLNSDQSVNNVTDAGGTPIATPSGQSLNNSSTNPALIVTSAPSRAETSQNVSTLNTVNGNIANTNANPPAPVTPPITPTPASTTTTNTSGTSNNTSTSTPATSTYTPPAGYTSLTMSNGTQGFYNQSTQQMVDSTGKPLTWNQQQNAWIDPSTGQAPVAPTTAPAGTGTSTTGAGSPPGLVSSTDLSSAVSQLPPSLQGLYTDSITAQNAAITSAYNTVQAATATYNNAVGGTDPAMLAAAQQITNQYAILIQQMQAKNAQVVGRASTAGAAYGGLGEMSQDFMNDETSAATARVGNLTTQMNDLILKSNQAYQTGDLKVLNDSITAYNQANTAQQKAISDLLTAVNNNVKENQAQQKIDAANAKTQNAQDISNSVKGASGALSLAESNYGVTDPSQLTPDQLSSLADAFGVTNPAILLSQMASAMATNQKNALAATNVQSEINKRNQVPAPKVTKLTGAQNDQNEVSGINQLLTTKDKDGTPYIDQDSLSNNGGKGYFTVAGFNTLLNNTTLTRAKFIKQYASYFSPDNLNNYGLTPAEIASIKNTGKTAG